MAKKKEVYKVKPLNENKKNIIAALIDDWQQRPLDDIYPIVFIDAVHFSVREDNRIRKLASPF